MRLLKLMGYLWAISAIATAHAQSPAHPGEAIYNRTCAGCHNNPQATRAPALESLRRSHRGSIEYAINSGYMKMQAMGLNTGERKQLVDWLVAEQQDASHWMDKARCSGKAAMIDANAKIVAGAFGLGANNLRQQTAEASGLRTADFAQLELAWAVALPQNSSMRSQPVIAGKTLFIAATDAGRMYALDTDSGCVKWQYEAKLPLRSSLSYGMSSPGRPVIAAGDTVGGVLAIDALNGKLLWRTEAAQDETQRITGTPVIHDDRVFVPLSSVEISHARLDTYECCKSQGAVVALDLRTGKQLWLGRTMPPATPQKKNRAGAQLWGPSGAPIWTSPAIDAKRNVLYVGTGENYSLPATNTSDAIIAFDLDTGERKWVFQATRNDVWNYACRNGANCDFGSAATIVDHDFGGSVMIVRRKNGNDLLVAGQKSGTVWALDPDRQGALVWSRQLGKGGANGGIHWGTATDGQRIFVPLNESKIVPDVPYSGPGLHALDLETGNVLWSRKAEPDCTGTRKQRYPNCESRLGYSPAPLVVDGAVVQGSVDGVLRVFDAATGKTLWSFDTMREFTTVNGVAGKGGSLDSAPYVAANGTLFVQSGYARFGESPGNVLLAFRPRRR